MGIKEEFLENEGIKLFIETLVDEECAHYNPNFEPYEAFRERYRRQFARTFKQSIEYVQEGIALIGSSSQFTEAEIQDVNQRLIDLDLNDPEVIDKIKNMAPIGLILDLPNEFYQKAYTVGDEALKENELDKAKKVFMALASLNPTYYLATVGLGMTCFKEGNYEEAINCYLNSIDFAEEDAYVIMVMIGDCLIALERQSEAEQFYDCVFQDTEGKEEFEVAYQMARDRKTMLEKGKIS